jgi:hypothetical protein
MPTFATAHRLSGGDLDRLARGRRARVQLNVNLFGDENQGAVFEGTYMVLPVATGENSVS